MTSLKQKNKSSYPRYANPHSTGVLASHLPKTHHMRGEIFDIIFIYFEKIISNFSSLDLITRSSNTNTILMIYTDLIELVGQYMTYEEFAREHPEIELSQNDWYSILDGRTMRTHKKELRQRYLEAFDDDWSNRRNIAFGLLNHAKKTSN